MINNIKIALWNANGLAQRSQELKLFITENKIDVVLLSETHFTDRSFFKIPHYTIYDTKHPDGTAHGGTAIIIRNSIKHHELPEYTMDHLQATTVLIEKQSGPVTLSAIYCPPRHNIKKADFEIFLETLGNTFIVGGDFNAKHTNWGSRLITSRGRELIKAIQSKNLNYISTGTPTYWPADPNKIPDLLDFCVTKNINQNYIRIEDSLDLSSDHTPVILTLSATITKKPEPPKLHNVCTDWEKFREILQQETNHRIRLKSTEDIEMAIEHLTSTIHKAAKASTPPIESKEPLTFYPNYIKEAIKEKRRIRRQWHNSGNRYYKTQLNRAEKELKNMLYEWNNNNTQENLSRLTPTTATDYSLWKTTKYLKRSTQRVPPIRKHDNTWARSDKEKCETFANHLTKVFQPFDIESVANEEEEIQDFLDSPEQLSLLMKNISINEIKETIKQLHSKKSPGHDLITGKILKELPDITIRLISFIFNAIIRLSHYPSQWKIAQIILIQKPDKPAEEVTSYRPISLLPIISKVFEKLLMKRLNTIIIKNKIIPDFQFGFRQKHATTEQIHRIVNKIKNDLEGKRYCSAAFLDIKQAFDKVWHKGLLFKIKKLFPNNHYQILKSYLSGRFFQIKLQSELSPLWPIESGVPQGSVLGPTLYILYTADFPTPTSSQVTIGTFADDTTVLASSQDPVEASHLLQSHLNRIEKWLKQWKIKANETKSAHITFTTRRETCPPVLLNNQPLPQVQEVKYLGLHLDRRLTWAKHIKTKRKQLGIKFKKLHWLLNNKSKVTSENKLLIYKIMLKPIWTYGIELWGTASTSNINLIQRFQSKSLRTVVNAPWYVKNSTLHNDLMMNTVQEEIKQRSEKYLKRLEKHPNYTAVNLLDNSTDTYRLKKFNTIDLPLRFNNL